MAYCDRSLGSGLCDSCDGPEHSLDCLVANYPTMSMTVGHLPGLGSLLSESLVLRQKDGGTGKRLYNRRLVGGVSEGTSSTFEFPDIDINALFKLPKDLVKVIPTQNGFLNEIKLIPGGEETMNEIIKEMQMHGQEFMERPVSESEDAGHYPMEIPENESEDDDTEQIKYSTGITINNNSIKELFDQLKLFVEKIKPLKHNTDKAYVKVNGETFLSSHLCRWQLQGPIKGMEQIGFDMEASSKMASEVGLLNGIYPTMEYDTSVCRRGHLKAGRLKKFVIELFGPGLKLVLFPLGHSLENLLDFLFCFYPPEEGLQVDYTAGFCVPVECIPDRDLQWKQRVSEASWPGPDLVQEVIEGGAIQVPKAFKNDGNKQEKARSWRPQFSLQRLIFDSGYGVDTKRVLVILKDIKNKVILSSHVKSYFLKVAVVWAMHKNADRRKTMSVRQLLDASLNELYIAYDKAYLPDFFSTKYNLLHRSRIYQSSLAAVAKKILEIAGNLDNVILFLYKEYNKFQENCLAAYKARLNKLKIDIDGILSDQEILKKVLVEFLLVNLKSRKDTRELNTWNIAAGVRKVVDGVFDLARMASGRKARRPVCDVGEVDDIICGTGELNIEDDTEIFQAASISIDDISSQDSAQSTVDSSFLTDNECVDTGSQDSYTSISAEDISLYLLD